MRSHRHNNYDNEDNNDDEDDKIKKKAYGPLAKVDGFCDLLDATDRCYQQQHLMWLRQVEGSGGSLTLRKSLLSLHCAYVAENLTGAGCSAMSVTLSGKWLTPEAPVESLFTVG